MKKVAFLCVHNSCRSQIAEALLKHYAEDKIMAYSAGTAVKDQINQDAVRIMKSEYGIDMEKTQEPKLIGELPAVDYIITMGCNVSCPVLPYDYQTEDWGLDDPTGKEDSAFIEIISIIDKKIKELIERLQ